MPTILSLFSKDLAWRELYDTRKQAWGYFFAGKLARYSIIHVLRTKNIFDIKTPLRPIIYSGHYLINLLRNIISETIPTTKNSLHRQQTLSHTKTFSQILLTLRLVTACTHSSREFDGRKLINSQNHSQPCLVKAT